MGNGLAFAGSISQMGQNLNQGLQTLNSGLVQMGVNQSLAKNDREFQLEKMDRQQKFEREILGDKMAADRKNALDQIEATGQNTKALAILNAGFQRDLHGDDNAAADARLDKTLDAQMSREVLGLGVQKEIKDKDRQMLSDRYKEMYSLEARKLAATKEAVHTLPTGDGRIAIMSPTGKALGYLKDPEGNFIKAPQDIPRSVIEQGNDIIDQMKDLTREYTKIPNHTEEQDDNYKTQKKELQQQLKDLYSQYNGGKPSTPVPKSTIVIPDKYKNIGQGTVLAPGQVPPSPAPAAAPPSGVSKSTGMMGAVKGVMPGMGMLENYLRK